MSEWKKTKETDGQPRVPERAICGHCGDPACWLGNECQGRVRSRYEFERAEKATRGLSDPKEEK